MDIFNRNSLKKLYTIHSAHVDSFNFKKMPKEIKKTIPAKDQTILENIPLIRLTEPRAILINEADEAADDFIRVFTMLNSMRDSLLHDIYSMYVKDREGITLDNFLTEDAEETYKRILLLFIPEILWCRGDDAIKSKIFS